jgi:cobalamin biosynthesis protein CobT
MGMIPVTAMTVLVLMMTIPMIMGSMIILSCLLQNAGSPQDDESNGDDDDSDNDNDDNDWNTRSEDNDDDKDGNSKVKVADQTLGFQENGTPNDGAVTPDEARSDVPNATGLDNHFKVPAEIAGVENDDQVA